MTDTSLSDQPIELTVALPLFRARQINWLALEGLCRQKAVTFGWELISAEEPEESFGEERMLEFKERLREAGCARIVYRPLDEWMPLSRKWLLLASMASPGSLGFVLHAADCYSHPRRLANTWRLFKEDPEVDWVQTSLGPMYHISTDRWVMFDYSLVTEYPEPVNGHEKHPTAFNMAIRTDHVRRLAPADVARGVDSWLFHGVQDLLNRVPHVAWDESRDCLKGMETHGLNVISVGREDAMEAVEPPFREFHETNKPLIPDPIMERLRQLRSQAYQRLLDQHKALITQHEAKLENFRGMIERRDRKIEKLRDDVQRHKQHAESLEKKLRRPLRRLFRG